MMKKRILISLLGLVSIMGYGSAQELSKPTTTETKPLQGLHRGISRSIPNGRVVIPYALEVGYDKTSHIIFPSSIRYVDLGNENITAGKAEEAENVLRVKATIRGFDSETNMSVICEDGSYYTFNVRYAQEPEKLSFEMQDFLYPGDGHLPSNRADIYFKELGNESPVLVKLIMQNIYRNNTRLVKHIAANQFGIKFHLRGIYTHNGLLYFHLMIENEVNIPYSVDFVSFKVIDKKLSNKTAMQERVINPLRGYHQILQINGHSTERSVFALEQFVLSDDKVLEVSLYEKNGGRTLTFNVSHEDLLNAERIDELKIKF